ncbi:MAG: AAA family ATPase [Candidatus Omnitrophica bacterium]|nr:AAA family ATPase [Candidatus Omnitrophota bacterium]
MKVISVVNQKGGCGKTITAVNLSAGLAKKGNKVLLIDLDPQAHASFSLRNTLGSTSEEKNNFTITDLLEKSCQDQKLPEGTICTPVSDNFYLIPSAIGLTSIEHKLAQREDKLQVLSSLLKKLHLDFDYCILDCPPNLGIITLNALWASKYSLIPLNTCDFSLKGVEMLKNILVMLKEFKTDVPTPFYLLSQVDKRSKFVKDFTERVKNQLGTLLLDITIRTNIHLKEAAGGGKDIFEYKSDSRGAQDFTALADKIQKLTTQNLWAPLFLKGKDLSEVYVAGNFNNWQKEERYKLRKMGEIWSINLSLEKGKYCYKFLTGDTWLTDPHNKLAENDSFGGKNSLLLVD